jgi:hypothetical protein
LPGLFTALSVETAPAGDLAAYLLAAVLT